MCRKERKQRKHCLISSSSLKNQSCSLAKISQAEVAKWANEIGVFKIEAPKLIISFREQLSKQIHQQQESL
jgi:hypothetical protein